MFVEGCIADPAHSRFAIHVQYVLGDAFSDYSMWRKEARRVKYKDERE